MASIAFCKRLPEGKRKEGNGLLTPLASNMKHSDIVSGWEFQDPKMELRQYHGDIP